MAKHIGLYIWILLVLATCTRSAQVYPDRCQPATDEQIQAINQAIRSLASTNYIQSGYCVKCTADQSVYIVAAMIDGVGLDHEIGLGIWAVRGEPDRSVTVFSINTFAKRFSGCKSLSATTPQLALTEDDLKRAEWCAVNQK